MNFYEFLDRNGFGLFILCTLSMCSAPDCIRAIREVPHATATANP